MLGASPMLLFLSTFPRLTLPQRLLESPRTQRQSKMRLGKIFLAALLPFALASQALAQGTPEEESTNTAAIDSPIQSQNLATVLILPIPLPTSYATETSLGSALGKKNSLILINSGAVNLAQNVHRQAFATVSGLTVWESDGTGTQTSIATRGLSPNRSWEFNMRQDGMDIAADPIGYPEAYYTPNLEAVERIEVIRGAGALQYGTQFGGVINYVMRDRLAYKGKNAALGGRVSQTFGANGLAATSLALGGGKRKMRYYAFGQRRAGDNWRERSAMNVVQGYGMFSYQITPRLVVKATLTHLDYTIQQPGGLTDSLFAVDARQSLRKGNWFQIRWTMPQIKLDYNVNSKLKLSLNSFALLGQRNSIGFTGAVNTPDSDTRRTLDIDEYTNAGIEARADYRYKLFGVEHRLQGGIRGFTGHTARIQGRGTANQNAEFTLGENQVATRDLNFYSGQAAIFAENFFTLAKGLTLSLGGRLEYIDATANGLPARVTAQRQRNVFLYGSGLSYRPKNGKMGEFFANYTTAYRPILFADLWSDNAALVIDPNLKDVTGFNADAGWRGTILRGLTLDASAFLLEVNGRSGNLAQNGPNPTTFRTNTGNSRATGAEVYLELASTAFKINPDRNGILSVWTSGGYTDAVYTAGSFKDKEVEYAPRYSVRTGVRYARKALSLNLQNSYVSAVYTDAANTFKPNGAATVGKIAQYRVWDFSARYLYKERYELNAGVNNLFDEIYATRRAGGYPGPGLMPGDGRTFYVGAAVSF